MRINKHIASSTGLSRRWADQAIMQGRVLVNGVAPTPGQDITSADAVTLDDRPLTTAQPLQTIMLNKPVGVVVSRDGQGSKTIYDILPASLRHLKPVGRLDKYSSGLLLLTNDGALANLLTHPRYQKTKRYEVVLHKPLAPENKAKVEQGVALEDGPSAFQLKPLPPDPGHKPGTKWEATLTEGRNRQIRRTFAALDYTVLKLHRTHFGAYSLATLASGDFCPAMPLK